MYTADISIPINTNLCSVKTVIFTLMRKRQNKRFEYYLFVIQIEPKCNQYVVAVVCGLKIYAISELKGLVCYAFNFDQRYE